MDDAMLIEAVLFWRAEPVAMADLAKWLDKSDGEIKEVLEFLEAKLSKRGIKLVRKDDEVMLGTAPEASELIERLTKEELSRDLGKAALETLSIIIYQGPLTRASIDYVRGVNSSFILRHLQIRGLIERLVNSADARSFLYRPTFQLLSYLGVTKVEELPDFESIKEELTNLATGQDKEEGSDQNTTI
ncbi:MAG: SMC-Scp complex subunit ScpB [Patescibacteria group bacterium]|nr:SMC-Scp complex subunit ScpB [Patescibacteria group bacterium]